ncbi:hypothetical protein CTEN210_07418 [Chaetoceros tenuissimus]|uniref:MCM10 OB-fold domain-containing protein n=1 Tax=Chaetoceros tenuissimus TaxID=426638 RepID=A0AAD3H535_9STRA|nr:hypothetical protein CTEN210_07418 [Chaetoceros tenuissimus]
MDDLLALMGSDNESDDEEVAQILSRPSSSTQQSSSRASNTTTVTVGSSKQSIQKNENSVQRNNTTKSTLNNSSSSGTVDPFTKIRIVQRKTSKVELVDILAPYQFHTTAVLAAMNNSQLSALITHPSKNNEGNSPSGRSDMATMGIVFSNSGTRISKNGRGFCILTLGDLHTGPTVSIFLFGYAYSSLTTKIQPGMVIAVTNSSIMPSRQGGETRISLSVNEAQQIVIVGKAMDYALCAGEDIRKSKENTGNGKVRCKKVVDLRCGRLCQYHQRLQVQGPAAKKSGPNKKNMTFIQSLKADRDMKKQVMSNFHSQRSNFSQPETSNTLNIHMPGQGKVVAAKLGTNQQRGGLGVSNALAEALGPNLTFGMNMKPQVSNNMQRAPKQMKMSSSTSTSLQRNIRLSTSSSGVRNPYAPKASVVVASRQVPGSSSSRATIDNSGGRDILGEAFSKGRKSMKHTPLTQVTKKSSNVRKRNLVHMEGMNGQVQVPKPSALFNRTAAPNSSKSNPYQSTAVTPSPQQKTNILERQREAASKLRLANAKLKSSKVSKMTASRSKAIASTAKTSELDALLGVNPLTDEMRTSILETKSKYSHEADAESYAKSRQALTELEKQEAKYDKSQTRKIGNGKEKPTSSSAIIVCTYKCVTCNKITSYKPSACIAANHKVKQKREIKSKKSITEKRLNLKTRSADEGGMVLGQGLEWSEWRS